MSEGKDELVRLQMAENELEAQIVQQVLADNGIRAMVRSIDPLLGRGVYMPSPFSTEVLVWAKDLERAREVLGVGERPRRRYRRRDE